MDWPEKDRVYLKTFSDTRKPERRLVVAIQQISRNEGRVWWRPAANPDAKERETTIKSWREWTYSKGGLARPE